MAYRDFRPPPLVMVPLLLAAPTPRLDLLEVAPRLRGTLALAPRLALAPLRQVAPPLELELVPLEVVPLLEVELVPMEVAPPLEVAPMVANAVGHPNVYIYKRLVRLCTDMRDNNECDTSCLFYNLPYLTRLSLPTQRSLHSWCAVHYNIHS